MVTVAQLKEERRRAFRSTRQALNRVRKAFNLLHRTLSNRLEGHYSELLDTKDAQLVVQRSQDLDAIWQDYKGAVVKNLEAFFR